MIKLNTFIFPLIKSIPDFFYLANRKDYVLCNNFGGNKWFMSGL